MDSPYKTAFKQPGIGPALVLDRMAEKRGDSTWVAEQLADPGSRFLLLADLSLAVVSDAERTKTEIRWYGREEIAALGADAGKAMFLGCGADGRAVFAIALGTSALAALPGGPDALKPLVDLRSLAMQEALPPEELSLVGAARALAAWHDSNRCCGRCGSRTSPKDAGWRRRCWACGQEFFPRTDPAVIVLVTDGERCLLGHHKRYAHKFYSTLAGFVEPGEDVEACVRREIREETGVEIGDVSYLASQPWPFPHLLMVGCWAEARTTDLTLDEEELWDARWFTREDVRAMMNEKHADGFTVPGPHSIAYSLIRSFVDTGQ